MTDRLDAPPDVPDEAPPTMTGANASAAQPFDEADEAGSAPDGLAMRVWRRLIRRPSAWADRPWTNDRIIRFVTTVFSLALTTGIMLNVVHLSPLANRDLVFDDTTPTGGDFGAHVWGPAFLRDHILPSGWFNGWSMDWYAGMPTYRFYMVLPAMLVVLVNNVLPYGVALKLVSVLGIVTMPASCWAFGRLAKFRHPIPELFAFAGVAFVLDESFQIYGGNLKSTMAGEFSFSIALSLAMLALGVLAAGLRTGNFRVWAAVLIAAACVSHGIVLIFVAGAATLFVLVWIDWTRLIYGATVGVTAVLLMMWWVGPFVLNHSNMTDMKYGGEPDGGSFDSWADMYFPLTAPLDMIITTLALIGLIACVVRRHLNGVALGVTAIMLAAAVRATKESLPGLGLLWNPRLLPFLYLTRYLLMMVGAVEVLGFAWNVIRDRNARQLPSTGEGAAFGGVSALCVLIVLGWMYQMLPLGGTKRINEGKASQADVYSWGPFHATSTNSKAVASGWSQYNFEGYEGRKSYYTEYYETVQAMQAIGDAPAFGCGRALWENNNDGNERYGTPMALMLLPFWTDGCIGSMEGLFFEASGTTPYHFLTAAAMSKQSSNPVRELRYVNNDATIGVRHLQDLGVRYVMVRTAEAKAAAAERPELRFVTATSAWSIYLVDGSDVVVPLAVQPVVVEHRDGDQRERNLELGSSWFQHPDEWAAMPADDGPDSWQRIDATVDIGRREPDRVDIVVPAQQIDEVELPPVVVSDIEVEQQSLSFTVDRPGVPVLVRVSYFPNWEADGAQGPYRIGPNMMVVVPDRNQVELRYGRSTVDYLTFSLTLLGIGLCVLWRKRGDVVHAAEFPAWHSEPRHDGSEVELAELDATTSEQVAREQASDWWPAGDSSESGLAALAVAHQPAEEFGADVGIGDWSGKPDGEWDGESRGRSDDPAPGDAGPDEDGPGAEGDMEGDPRQR